MEKIKKNHVKEIVEQLSFFYETETENLKQYYFYINKNNKVYISSINLENFSPPRINTIGLYFGTLHDGNRFRLSIEGSKFVNPQSNYIYLSESTVKNYLSGENLFENEIEEINYKNNAPFLIVIYNNHHLGCVSKKDNEFLNFIPKARRLDFNKMF